LGEIANEKIIEELIGELGFGDFNWEDLADDIQWLVENVSEEELARLSDIVVRLAELFAET